MCLNEEDAIFKSMLRCLQHSTSLVSALPEQLSASSKKVATQRGGACIMSAPVTDKQHGFLGNRQFVANRVGGITNCRQYSVCHGVCEINFKIVLLQWMLSTRYSILIFVQTYNWYICQSSLSRLDLLSRTETPVPRATESTTQINSITSLDYMIIVSRHY